MNEKVPFVLHRPAGQNTVWGKLRQLQKGLAQRNGVLPKLRAVTHNFQGLGVGSGNMFWRNFGVIGIDDVKMGRAGQKGCYFDDFMLGGIQTRHFQIDKQDWAVFKPGGCGKTGH